jgi:hypothetical protein
MKSADGPTNRFEKSMMHLASRTFTLVAIASGDRHRTGLTLASVAWSLAYRHRPEVAQ